MQSGRRDSLTWSWEKVKQTAAICITLQEFRKNHPVAYKAVCRNGWHNLLVNLQRDSHPHGYWTLERLEEEAKMYSTRTEFSKSSPAAYQAAHRKGCLSTVCSHMERKFKPSGYWTRERVLEEAKKYHSRTEFQKHAGGAYSIAARGGYLNESCVHMAKKGSQYERAIYAFEFADHSVYVGLTFDYNVRYREHLTQNKHIGRKLKEIHAEYIRLNEWLSLENAGKAEAETIERYRNNGWTILNRMKPGGVGSRPRKWSFKEIKCLAEQYGTVKSFIAENPVAYAVACKHGWWTEIGSHMKRSVEHGKWTLATVLIEARKYETRRDFEKNSPGGYGKARKMGWIDSVCQHMVRQVKPTGYWTHEVVRREAQKHKSRGEFRQEAPAAYMKACREGWLDDVCANMVQERKPSGYWTFERVGQEAKKFRTKKEFQSEAVSAYNRAHKNGWLEQVCFHMDELRRPNGYWTKEQILAEVSKFALLKEFRESSGGAYDAAYEMGLMPLIQQQLKMDKKPNGYWTLERVKEEAKKYATRGKFMHGSLSAYSKAHKMGWLNDVCAHMAKPK